MTNSPSRPPLPKSNDYDYVKSMLILALNNGHDVAYAAYLANACCDKIAHYGRLPDSDEARALSRLSRHGSTPKGNAS